MDFGDTPQEAAFRREVREFVRRELPPELCRELMSVGSITDMRYSFDRGPAMQRRLVVLIAVAVALVALGRSCPGGLDSIMS